MTRVEMTTEIRSYGDRKTVVVYTDDKQVYRRLRKSTRCIRIIPYEQKQRTKIALVGVDLYFQRKHRAWLEKLLGLQKVPIFT